jgi:hypothetical protein
VPSPLESVPSAAQPKPNVQKTLDTTGFFIGEALRPPPVRPGVHLSTTILLTLFSRPRWTRAGGSDHSIGANNRRLIASQIRPAAAGVCAVKTGGAPHRIGLHNGLLGSTFAGDQYAQGQSMMRTSSHSEAWRIYQSSSAPFSSLVMRLPPLICAQPVIPGSHVLSQCDANWAIPR